MKDYLMLFRNVSGNGAYISTAEDMARDMPAWQAWIGQIAMQGKLISSQPIDYEGLITTNQGQQSGPYTDGANQLVAGFLMCKAESLEEVMGWSKTCPILRYEHGSVEVRGLVAFPL